MDGLYWVYLLVYKVLFGIHSNELKWAQPVLIVFRSIFVINYAYFVVFIIIMMSLFLAGAVVSIMVLFRSL